MQITLKEGEKVYQESQIEELLKQLDKAREDRDQARLQISEQKILINQSIKVFGAVQKLFPGLSTGKVNGTDIMNITKVLKTNSSLVNDIANLNKCIEQYTAKNPVIL